MTEQISVICMCTEFKFGVAIPETEMQSILFHTIVALFVDLMH